MSLAVIHKGERKNTPSLSPNIKLNACCTRGNFDCTAGCDWLYLTMNMTHMHADWRTGGAGERTFWSATSSTPSKTLRLSRSGMPYGYLRQAATPPNRTHLSSAFMPWRANAMPTEKWSSGDFSRCSPYKASSALTRPGSAASPIPRKPIAVTALSITCVRSRAAISIPIFRITLTRIRIYVAIPSDKLGGGRFLTD